MSGDLGAAPVRPEATDHRWLEADSPQVRAFLAEQAVRTESHLGGLALRGHFRQRVDALLSRPRHDLVGQAGSWVYAVEYGGTRHGSLVRASCVDGLSRESAVVYDVAAERSDVTLMAWYPCGADDLLACLVSPRGSVVQQLRVVDPDHGTVVDSISGVRGLVAHCPQGTRSVLYIGAARPRASGQDLAGMALWRHEIGADPASDEILYCPPYADGDDRRFLRLLGGGEGWAVLGRDQGPKSPNDVLALHVDDASGSLRTLATAASGLHRLVGVRGGEVYLITSEHADRNRVVAIDPTSGAGREVVAEVPGRMLLRGVVTSTRLGLKYSRQGSQELVLFDLATGRSEQVDLGDYASIGYLGGDRRHDRIFVVHSSLGTPATCLCLEGHGADRPVASAGRPAAPVGGRPAPVGGRPAPVGRPSIPVGRRHIPGLDLNYHRLQAASADGTRVPVLAVTPRDGRRHPRPLLLYAYGGFGVALRPGFSPMFYPWLEAGGAFAMAHVRGGGELGTSWHQAAVRHGRHRAFADLYASAELLISQGYTTTAQMVLHGRSNGGLLAAVALLQRPDLWAAVMASAGIYDMARFHHCAVGRAWIQEFGDPDDPGDLAYIMGYSPIHNIADGVVYPPVMISVGGKDERVPASHSWKFAAALIAASAPAYLLADPDAGHGFGARPDELTCELGDLLAFAAEHAGLGPPTTRPPGPVR